MAFVLGYEPDCFISYSHIDNDPSAPGEDDGWVTQFTRDFRRQLNELLGVRVDVWRDVRLAGNTVFPDELRDRVQGAALLVVIVSPGYDNSAWCRREFTTFHERAVQTGRWEVQNQLRALKVVRIPLRDNGHYTRPFEGDSGYPFFRVDQDDPSRTIRFNPGDAGYTAEVARVAEQAAATLRLLQQVVTSGVRASEPRRQVFYCHAAGADEASARTIVAGCVASEQPDELVRRMRALEDELTIDPRFSGIPGLINRMRRQGVQHALDPPEVRARVLDAIATWPFDAYLSFCVRAADAPTFDGAAWDSMLRGTLFDRLRALGDVAAEVVTTPALPFSRDAVAGRLAEWRVRIAQTDAAVRSQPWTTTAATAADRIVALTDYVCAIVRARIDAPDSSDARLFPRLYPNKIRVLADAGARIVYTRRRPFPPDWRSAH
jgi:hypothetical protein